MRCALIASLLGISVCLPATAGAQARGDRAEAVHPVVFQVMADGIALDPTANVREASRVEFTRLVEAGKIQQPDLGLDLLVGILENIGISIPGWLVDFIDAVGEFSSVDISASMGPFLEARYGGYFQVQPSSRARLDLNAAVGIVNTAPAINTFRCGEEIAIHTAAPRFSSDAALSVTPASYNYEIGPVLKDVTFGAQVGVDIDLCIGLDLPEIGCAGHRESFHPGSQRISTNVPLPSFLDPVPPMIKICDAAFQAGANETTLLGCSAGPITPLFNHWQRSLDALNSVPGVHFSFAEFSPGQVKIAAPDLPSPVSFTVPEVEALFQQPGTVTGAGTGGPRLTAAATKTDLASASLDLISLLEYGGIPTALSLGGDLGSIDIGDIAPTFHIDQNMRYEFTPAVSMSMNLGTPMPYRVIDPAAGQVASGLGSTVTFTPGQTVMLAFPQAMRDPVTVTNAYAMGGDLSTRTSHQYRLSAQLKALKIKVGPIFSFTALDEEIDLSGAVLPEHVIENHTLNFPAAAPVTRPGLTLDPESPRVSITAHAVHDSLNLGGGERAVVYKTSVRNDGDVTLSNADLRLDLARAFSTAPGFQAICVASADLPANRSYDGTASANLLEAGTSLAPGQQGTLDVLVRVMPEVARVTGNGCFTPVAYSATPLAGGVSPIGTMVRNNLNECTGERTGADIVSVANLGASTIGSVSDFAIYGASSVVFDKASGVSYGNVGSGGNIHFKKTGAAEPLQIVGDIHAGQHLHIGQSRVSADYVQVHDKLNQDPKSSLFLNGALSESSACAAPFELPSLDFARLSAGAQRVSVPAGGSVVLSPGDYRSIQVARQGTVTLRAGVYNLQDLDIAGDGVTLLADVSGGEVTINVDSWRLGKSQGLRLVASGGGSRSVHVNYTGHAPLAFNGAILHGAFVAPDAGILLDQGSQVLGSLHAARVDIGTGVAFRHHRYLEPLKIDPVCVRALEEALRVPAGGQLH